LHLPALTSHLFWIFSPGLVQERKQQMYIVPEELRGLHHRKRSRCQQQERKQMYFVPEESRGLHRRKRSRCRLLHPHRRQPKEQDCLLLPLLLWQYRHPRHHHHRHHLHHSDVRRIIVTDSMLLFDHPLLARGSNWCVQVLSCQPIVLVLDAFDEPMGVSGDFVANLVHLRAVLNQQPVKHVLPKGRCNHPPTLGSRCNRLLTEFIEKVVVLLVDVIVPISILCSLPSTLLTGLSRLRTTSFTAVLSVDFD
jgi:hypothetical protein